MLNPRRITWTAPTENTDGTAIDYQLAYALLVDGEPVADFPGTLNPDGTYEALFADLPPIHGEAEIALVAFDVAIPDRRSAPSGTLQVAFFPNPLPPTNLGAE